MERLRPRLGKFLAHSLLFFVSLCALADGPELQLEGDRGREILTDVFSRMQEKNAAMPFEFLFTVVPSLPGGRPSEITPEILLNKKLGVHLRITEEGLKNPAVLVEDLITFRQISGTEYFFEFLTDQAIASPKTSAFHSPMQWAEIYWNAEAGSANAKLDLARHRLETVVTANRGMEFFLHKRGTAVDKNAVDEYYRERRMFAEREVQSLEAVAKKDNQLKLAQWAEKEEARKALEKAPLKLNDLIAANDRSGVRKVIEAYLPWPMMDAIETGAWKQWLEALEHPSKDPTDQTVLFRGMDPQGDRLYENKRGGNYLMSTMLTRNQGNFNRRLRSYNANRMRLGSLEGYKNKINEVKDYPTLTGMFASQARNPMGSPFLSFSNLHIAEGFAENGILAARVDARRQIGNAISGYSEFEVLVPYIIFPDEVVAVERWTKPTIANTPAELEAADADKAKKLFGFRKKVEDKIGRSLTPAELQQTDASKAFEIEAFYRIATEYGKGACPKLFRGLVP